MRVKGCKCDRAEVHNVGACKVERAQGQEGAMWEHARLRGHKGRGLQCGSMQG